MPQERTAPPMSDFFKFKHIGQTIVGRIADYKTGKNGPMVVMAPALLSHARGEPLQMWDRVAVGLTTDLAMKVKENDKGQWLGFTFSDTQASDKGSPRKVFKVEQFDVTEVTELSQHADRTHRHEPYKAPDQPQGQSGATAADDEDDLPF